MSTLFKTETNPGSFFACANTGEGFVSYYKEIFANLKHLYIIKGGPGTGKSTFMKRLAEMGEKAGIFSEKIYCSSDPSSLDALLFPSLKVGFADGTSPHLLEPSLVGIREHFLDFSAFLSIDEGDRYEEKVLPLQKEKKMHYEEAFLSLSSASSLFKARDRFLSPLILENPLISYLEKLLARLNVEKEEKNFIPKRRVCFRSALSMKGAVRFSYPLEKAEKVLYIPPFYGVENRFLEELQELLMEQRKSFEAFLNPLTLETEALFLTKEKLFFTGEKPQKNRSLLPNEKMISTRRFLKKTDASQKALLKRLEKGGGEALKIALAFLEKAEEKHGALEELYQKKMDFSKIDLLISEFSTSLFGKEALLKKPLI